MRDASLNLPKLISDKAKYQPKLQRVRWWEVCAISQFSGIKIVEVRIRNFRSLKEVDVPLVLRNESYKFYYSPYNKDCV